MLNLNTELITNQIQELKIQQNPAGENSAPVNIPIGKNESLDELCNRLQITREQLDLLTSKYTNFLTSSEDQQRDWIYKLGKVEMLDSRKIDERRVIAATFMNADEKDKIKILQIELAKNIYLSEDYGRSIDNWNKLDAYTQDFYIKQAEKTVSETVYKQNDSGEKKFSNYSAEEMLVNIFVADNWTFSSYDENGNIVLKSSSYDEISKVTYELIANTQDPEMKKDFLNIISARYDTTVSYGEGIFYNSVEKSLYAKNQQDLYQKQKANLKALQEDLEKLGIKTNNIENFNIENIDCAGDLVTNKTSLLEYLNTEEIKEKLPKEMKDAQGNVTAESIKVYYDNKNGQVDENTRVAEQVAKIGYDPNKSDEIDSNNIFTRSDIQEQLASANTSDEKADIIYQKAEELAKDSEGKIDNKKLIQELNKVRNYLSHIGQNDLAQNISAKISDFEVESNEPLEVGTNSDGETYARVANRNGLTTSETASEYTKVAVETGNKELIAEYDDDINCREDRQEVRKMTNKKVAESEKATDESKAYYAQYTVETAATEEERNNQVADLQQYNLDSFNKGVENAYGTIAQNNTDSATTSQSSISKTSSSSTTSEVETMPAQYTAYQTNPISNDRVEIVQTPKTEAAKSVYEQIVSGKASLGKIAEVFNNLSSDEKVNVLKSLTSSEIVKMPVSICGLCPEFIPQFVAAKKGIEVIKTVPDAAAATILHMKKSNDREVQKDLQVFMIEHPDQFMKISVANAREKLGVREDDNRLINHIRFRA